MEFVGIAIKRMSPVKESISKGVLGGAREYVEWALTPLSWSDVNIFTTLLLEWTGNDNGIEK